MSLRIVPFSIDDIPGLLEQIPDEHFMHQWSGSTFDWPLTAHQLIHYYQSASQSNSCIHIFKAVLEDGMNIGHAERTQIDRDYQSARLSLVLIYEALRNQGYGRQLIQGMCRQAFEILGLHRLDLFVFDFNETAKQCYENIGFKTEGLLREVLELGGRYWSSYLMSMLESEWRPQ